MTWNVRSSNTGSCESRRCSACSQSSKMLSQYPGSSELLQSSMSQHA